MSRLPPRERLTLGPPRWGFLISFDQLALQAARASQPISPAPQAKVQLPWPALSIGLTKQDYLPVTDARLACGGTEMTLSGANLLA